MQMLPLNNDPMETDADRRAEMDDDIDIDIDFDDEHLLEEDASMSEGDVALDEQILATTPLPGGMYYDDEMVDDGHGNVELLYDESSLREDVQNAGPLAGNQTDQGYHEQNHLVHPNQHPNLGPAAGGHSDGQQQLDNHNPMLPNGAPQALSQDDVNKGVEQVGNADEKPGPSDASLNQNGLHQPKPLVDFSAFGSPSRQVFLTYEGSELSLFRPISGDQEFLLEDETLIDQGLIKLLGACKPVLGEEVANRELVIGADDLDLEISEFAVEAAVTTVSHLNDLYFKLQLNDGTKVPEKLHLNLYSRPTISDRLSYLRHAVENGIGLASVSRVPDNGSDFEGSSETLEQEDVLSVQSEPNTTSQQAPRVPRTLPKVGGADEPVKDTSKAEKSTVKGTDKDLKNQDNVEKSVPKNSSDKNKKEKNPQTLAPSNDDEDKITFEEEEEIESTKPQTSAPVAQPASDAGVPPNTDTISKLPAEPLTNNTSNSLPANSGEADKIDGPVEKDDGNLGVSEHGNLDEDKIEFLDQEDEFQVADEDGHQATTEGGDHHEDAYNENGKEGENDTLESNNFDLDLGNDTSVYLDPEEANTLADENFGNEENFNDPTQVSAPNPGNVSEFKEPANVEKQVIAQADGVDDNDEITFDEEEEVKLSNDQEDQLLNPISLKKRSRTDEDASDPQDAKRIRSN